MKVILANRSLGITAGTVSVSGHSRRHLGYSTYSDRWGCHVVELTLEDYEACIDDLSRNWHKSRGRWVPHFVEGDAVPSKVIVTQESHAGLREMITNLASKLTDDDIRRIANERGIILTVTVIDNHADQGSTIPIPQLASVGDTVSTGELPTKYLSLCKIAREEGVDISGLERKGEAVRAAILNHRQQKAA